MESHGRPSDFETKSNIWFNVRSPTMFYTGRENELQKIQKQWKECEGKKMMLFAAVTGLGGIGKSELARNYAKQFYEIEEGHCIWIDAETNQTLSQSFQHLAENHFQLHLDEEGNEKSLNTLAKEIYEKISNEKCLIIFDNMESYENSILTLLIDLASKQAPTILKPFVIITSRFKHANKFFGDKSIYLDLDILSKDSAQAFFSKSFALNEDSTDDNMYELFEKLCKRLGNHPLAMQQAASYIKANLPIGFNETGLATEITKYLEEIDKGAENKRAHKLPQYQVFDDASKTISLTCGITVDRIENLPGIGNIALKLMEIISFLSPDNISIELLSKLFERTVISGKSIPNCPENCLQALRDQSMITLRKDKSVSIHRLVQEVTRIGLRKQGKLTSTLDQLLKVLKELIEKEEIPSDQIIHCEVAWGHAKKNKVLVENHQHFPQCILIKLANLGKYKEVYEFSCQALSTLESILGEKNRWTLRTKYLKGKALKELGQYSECLSLLTEVYGEQKEAFGEDEKDCLDTANEIGTVHWRLSNHEEALKWYGNTLEKREKMVGKENKELLKLKHNIAGVLNGQGKYKEAMEMYTEVLDAKERVLGQEHQSTLSTKMNLATVRFEQEEYEDALKIFKEVLAEKERVLKLDHPDTLSTKHWIADTYKSLGRKEEAIQLATEVFKKRMEILGPEHPDTIKSKDLSKNVMEVCTNNL